MQSDRGQDQRRPFDLFGGFDDFGSIHGRNPFDDPFFTTRPFGSSFNQNKLRVGPDSAVPLSEPVIQELNSDDDSYGRENNREECPKNTRHMPFVDHPDDESDGGQKDTGGRTDDNRQASAQPQSSKFHSCKVTYGGIDGVYYSSSSTRRMGSDGVIIEECKEADKSKGEASHRISRGLHDKGHTVTRKLNPDGKVDTLQTLHNLNEDELGNFEEAWRSNSGSNLPSWTGSRGSSTGRMSNTLLLPSTGQTGEGRYTERKNETQADPSGGRTRKVVRIPVE